MNKGLEIYRKIIDDLVERSQNCAVASLAVNAEAKGNDEHIENLNKLLKKLTKAERETLAKYALDAYMDGIYDTLCDIEWYIDCKDMKISVEGEELPTTEYEGLGNDFIGRREGWDWPE